MLVGSDKRVKKHGQKIYNNFSFAKFIFVPIDISSLYFLFEEVCNHHFKYAISRILRNSEYLIPKIETRFADEFNY